MKENYKLSAYEQETTINYNQEEKTAEIYTHHPLLIRKLDINRGMYPDKVKLVKVNEYGGKTYIIPKKCINIRIPKPMNLTDEQRKAKSERMKNLHKNKAN